MPSRTDLARLPLAAALAAAALAALPAAAETRHVDAANTTGVEDGTAAAPYSAIQEAIDAAVAGDVVSVAPGIYYENVTLKDQVNLVSQRGAAATVIDGRGGYVVGSWFQPMTVRAVVDGFTIRNGSTLVHAVTAWNVPAYTQITVRRCVVRDGAMGVRASIKSGFVFENVVFTNVGQAVSAIWGYWPVALRNVTIDRAAEGAWLYQIGLSLHNTTITNTGVALRTTASYGSVRGSHNNFHGNEVFVEGNLALDLAQSLDVEPLFVGPPDDYRLGPGSPLVDAGIDVGLPYAGAAPDIGAFESPSTPAEQVAALAASIHDAPPATFAGPAEQRRNAVYRDLMAVVNMFASIRPGTPAEEKQRVLTGVAAKLRHDVLAKADGFFGGNPANDWITDPAEQAEFHPRVLQLLEDVEAALAAAP